MLWYNVINFTEVHTECINDLYVKCHSELPHTFWQDYQRRDCVLFADRFQVKFIREFRVLAVQPSHGLGHDDLGLDGQFDDPKAAAQRFGQDPKFGHPRRTIQRSLGRLRGEYWALYFAAQMYLIGSQVLFVIVVVDVATVSAGFNESVGAGCIIRYTRKFTKSKVFMQ